MSERKLYKKLEKNWNNYIQRIEPKDVGSGIPDCHLVNSSKKDIFVELKFLQKEFKKRVLPIKNSQFIWHINYTGTNAYMLFQVSSCFYLFHSSRVKYLRGKVDFDTFEDNAIAISDDLKIIIKLFE